MQNFRCFSVPKAKEGIQSRKKVFYRPLSLSLSLTILSLIFFPDIGPGEKGEEEKGSWLGYYYIVGRRRSRETSKRPHKSGSFLPWLAASQIWWGKRPSLHCDHFQAAAEDPRPSCLAARRGGGGIPTLPRWHHRCHP